MDRGRCGSGCHASGCVWMVFSSGLCFFVVLVEGSGCCVVVMGDEKSSESLYSAQTTLII